MSFFHSLSVRISLAVLGGVLYAALSYSIVIFLGLSSDSALLLGALVFLFYCGSRLLILFSGIDSPYYSRRKATSGSSFEKDTFYQTAQWVGRLYHYHDIVLLVFLVILSMAFLISLVIDGLRSQPVGSAFQNLRDALTPLSGNEY